MTNEVVHVPAQHQYLLLEEGEEIGHISYSDRGDERLITSTYVDENFRGGGRASFLVKSAVDDIIQTTNKKITSGCWYATKWLELHPDYVEKGRSGGVDDELGYACRINN